MKRTPLLLAVLAAVALLGAACGKDEATPASAGAPTTSTEAGDTTTTGGETTTTSAPEDEGAGGPSDTPEAEARAELAALLDEHVYLAGITVTRLVAEGGASPNATAAAATLDRNSVALSEAVSSGYDPEVGEDFLRIWRGHVTAYVEYTNASVANDTGTADTARETLDTFTTETGDLFESASEEAISADEVAEGLSVHVTSTLAAIDATVGGSPNAVSLLREAAGHAPDAAATWAAGMFPAEA